MCSVSAHGVEQDDQTDRCHAQVVERVDSFSILRSVGYVSKEHFACGLLAESYCFCRIEIKGVERGIVEAAAYP